MNKRAIQLSVNFLVIIILSLAMLLMGILFFRKMFTGATELKANLDSQTEQELENLLIAGERVAIPFTKKEVRAGKTAVFGLGILNILGSDHNFVIYIKCSKKIPGDVPCSKIIPSGTDIIYRTPLSIENNEQYKMPLVIKAPSEKGTYIIDVRICHDDPTEPAAPAYDFDGDCDGRIIGSPDSDEYYDGSLHKIYLKVS